MPPWLAGVTVHSAAALPDPIIRLPLRGELPVTQLYRQFTFAWLEDPPGRRPLMTGTALSGSSASAAAAPATPGRCHCGLSVATRRVPGNGY